MLNEVRLKTKVHEGETSGEYPSLYYFSRTGTWTTKTEKENEIDNFNMAVKIDRKIVRKKTTCA